MTRQPLALAPQEMVLASAHLILIGTRNLLLFVSVITDTLAQIAPEVTSHAPPPFSLIVSPPPSVICPKGDDPATDHQNYRSLTLTVTGALGFEGSLGLNFQGEKTWIDLPATSANTIQNILESNPKFGEVSVSYSSSDTASSSTHLLSITFMSWPTVPKENNLYDHSGNPPITDFTCDTSLLHSSDSVTCLFVDSETSYLRGILPLPCLLPSHISPCPLDRVRALQQQRDL
jgi:hypothetical protein